MSKQTISSDTPAGSAVRALASSTMYNYGSLMRPNIGAIPKTETRGYAPRPLQQWVMQLDQFENDLISQYQTVKPGEARLLIAATGVGKTTNMPARISAAVGKAGIVIIPDEILMASVVLYVKRMVEKIPALRKVKILPLRSEYVLKPVMGPVVYYTNAQDFLPRVHSDKTLMQRMSVDYLYIDEAHVEKPAHKIIRLLVEQGFFGTAKVFFGTATSAGTSLILTGKQGDSRPVALDPTKFSLQDPGFLSHVSPAFYSNIQNRTLIFLPDDATIDVWRRYYDDHDVPVECFYTYSTSTRFQELQGCLEIQRPLVVLSCSRLETGFTMSVDTVICSGKTQQLELNFTPPAAYLRVRNVTAVERTQRMGRVNRHLPGAAYYVNVNHPDPSEIEDETVPMYVWMWAKLFNIRLQSSDVSKYDELFYGFSETAISYFLCSKLNPILIMPYITDDGRLFEGWGILKNVFVSKETIRISDESNEEFVSDWPLRNTGPKSWVKVPEEYKSRSEFPDDWQALPYLAWYSFTDGLTNVGIPNDTDSVVSALVGFSGDRARSKVREKSLDSSARAVRSRSVLTTIKHSPTYSAFDFDPRQEVTVPIRSGMQTKRETRYELPLIMPHSLNVTAKDKKDTFSDVTEEIVRTNDVEKWVKNHAVPEKSKRSSSGSSESFEKHMISLRQVDPVKYSKYKLYPMDTVMLTSFLEQEAVRSNDRKRMQDLISARHVFTSMSTDPDRRLELQRLHFLSVLRIHNHSVMALLQMSASSTDTPSFFRRAMGATLDAYNADIFESARLLKAMDFEGFFVGIDTRTKHTESTTSSDALVKRNLARNASTADFFLMVCNPAITTGVSVASRSCGSVRKGDRILGTVWHFGRVSLVPRHVVAELNLDSVLIDNEDDDFALLSSTRTVNSHLTMRGAVLGEEVVLAGINPHTGKFSRYGPAKVIALDPIPCVDLTLDHGFSGFAIISTTDVAMVGLYLGYYSEFRGKDTAHFVSTSAYIQDVARFYG